MNKKIIALLVAVVLCCGMAMPAFADSSDASVFQGVVFQGTTIQDGSGAPTPENIRALRGSISGSIETADGYIATVEYPQELYGDGIVNDTFEPYVIINGIPRSRTTRYWKKLIITSSMLAELGNAGLPTYYILVKTAEAYVSDDTAPCSHFPHVVLTGGDTNEGWSYWNTEMYFRWPAMFSTVPEFRNYVDAQQAAGTPVTVLVRLSTPAVTLGDPAAPSSMVPVSTPTPTPTPTATPVVTPAPTPVIPTTTPIVTPVPTASPAPTARPTLPPYAVNPDDLDGADGAINDAQTMLDGVYDNLPELSGGVLGFMGATVQLLPDWFVAVICLDLILAVFIIFLRFLWQ